MGRTLHFTLTKDTNFTDEDIKIFEDMIEKYHSGEYTEIWTCEDFYCKPYQYWLLRDEQRLTIVKYETKLMNHKDDPMYKFGMEWCQKEIEFMHKSWFGEVFETMDEILKKYSIELNCTRIKLLKYLKRNNLIYFRDENSDKHLYDFVKVRDNEYDAYLLYTILIELSKKIKNATITLHDEGEFLFCDVLIRNGKAIADLNELKKHIEWLSTSFLPDELKNDMRELRLSTFGCGSEMGEHYIKQDLKKIYAIYDNLRLIIKDERIIKNCIGINDYIDELIRNKEYTKWFDPYIFCRKEEAIAMKNKEPENNIMSGFSGVDYNIKGSKEEEKLNNELSNGFINTLNNAINETNSDLTVIDCAEEHKKEMAKEKLGIINEENSP